MMIKVQVFLKNNYSRGYEDVEISKEEIISLACEKAKGRYHENHWEVISADEVEININA